MSRSGFATKDEAETALDDLRGKVAKGVVVNDRLTVAAYLRDWIAGKENELKPTTFSSYTGYIDRFWEPHLGHLKLSDLRVAHVQSVFAYIDERNELIRSGRLTKTRVISAASKQRIRATLRSALSDALREGLVSVNVAALVKLPSGKRPKALVWTEGREAAWREKVDQLVQQGKSYAVARDLVPPPSPVMVWRADHLGKFLDHVASHRMYALWHLLSHRGPRRGEACGLEWPDVDLGTGSVTIERQRICLKGKAMEYTPKSEAGGRVIALGKEGVTVLKAHRSMQRREQLQWGEAYVRSGEVFTQEDGAPLNPEWVSDEFETLSIELGLPPIRLHDLRHVAASLMLAAGVDIKVVQETLGHANAATTSDVYTSIYPEVAHASADAVANIVPRTKS